MKVLKHKKLYKVLSTIENLIAVIFWFSGFLLESCISDSIPRLIVAKILGIVLIVLGYLSLKEE